MAAPAKPLPNVYEQFLATPPGVVAEIIHGRLVTNPRPGAPHATAGSVLGGELMGPFHRGKGGPGGWVILDEPELHLREGNILVPDLAGWRRERMPQIPDANAFELAPDWACEIASPSTAALDRSEKMPIYAREGVRHLWIVDPLVRTLEVYRLEADGWRVVATWRDDALVRAEPFEAIELELGALWAR